MFSFYVSEMSELGGKIVSLNCKLKIGSQGYIIIILTVRKLFSLTTVMSISHQISKKNHVTFNPVNYLRIILVTSDEL